MDKDLREIEEITFGIFSPEEIRNISVAKIESSKLCTTDKSSGYGTVYDPRLGTIENGVLCEMCSENIWQCPGHWGHIELNEAIIHPLFYKQVVNFLRCFCIKCFTMLITEDQINLSGLNRIKSVKRFEKILEKLEKIDICHNCSQLQPDIKYTTNDNCISLVYKQKDKGKVSIILPVDEIKKTFDNIDDKDVQLLGFNTKLVHPRNLILTVFPVIPIACRPYIITQGNICDDDLTIQLVEIIKANNHLQMPVEGSLTNISETKRQQYLQSLKFRIATFYNNCVSPETPILMWDGSIKRADEIQYGDELIGDDGEKRNVQSVCSGEDEMYEISQNKGDTYIVNSNHVLTLKFSGHKNIFWVKADSNSPMGSYCMKWYDNSVKIIKNKIVSVTEKRNKEESLKYLKKIRDTINISETFDIHIKDYISLPKSVTQFFMGFKLNTAINWGKKNVLIDPYILGMWLGDGDYNCKEWDTAILQNYNLINDKHIPNEFLFNDEKTRLQLLAGIIDTNGHVYNDGTTIIISQSIKREKLIKQIHFLSKSLGFYSVIEKGYEVTISGHGISKIPTLLEKKKCFEPKERDDTLRSNIKLKNIGIGKYNGFSIDNNHRFLLGDFTVTHNSNNKAKHTTNGRPLKALKERLTGKLPCSKQMTDY